MSETANDTLEGSFNIFVFIGKYTRFCYEKMKLKNFKYFIQRDKITSSKTLSRKANKNTNRMNIQINLRKIQKQMLILQKYSKLCVCLSIRHR